MMRNPIIEIENLGKMYRIGAQREPYLSLRDSLSHKTKHIWNILRGKERGLLVENDFWALKNISFSVNQGEAIGIIGRNGAGKSTLLKILSQITPPTEGRITMRGRVASLLEVGTGFHPELSGRENIFLNGSILGMTRREIRNKFDEIVDFAGVEKFLDTPVKRYSSGMYVRLAFAVAAHLEPEILVVDEVLAVGDIQFQKKCLGKMKDVAIGGRTVIFVSHNLAAINALCDRLIVITNGCKSFDGPVQEGIDTYISTAENIINTTHLSERQDRKGNQRLKAESFRILNDKGVEVKNVYSGRDYTFALGVANYTKKFIERIIVSIDIFDATGRCWLMFRNDFQDVVMNISNNGVDILCNVSNFPLTKGNYYVSVYLSISDLEMLDYVYQAHRFEVVGGDYFGTGSYGQPGHCKLLKTVGWDLAPFGKNNEI